MYQLEISDQAVKSFKKIHPQIKKSLIARIDALQNFSPSFSQIKALRGNLKGMYRLRCGNYRILFQVINSETKIIIIDVFPRGEEYE